MIGLDKDGERWTTQQIPQLVEYARVQGMGNAAIAVLMGRGESAIATAISRYAVRNPDATLRKCMPCQRPFFSTHIGNRICGGCLKIHQLECA
jgi:hypothetical protein